MQHFCRIKPLSPVLTVLVFGLAIHAPVAWGACADSALASDQRVPIQDELGESVAVIIGKAESKRELRQNAASPAGASAVLIHFRVVQLLRGNIPEQIDVREDGAAAGAGYEIGHQYVLFVERRGPRWSLPLGDAYYVNDCGNSGPVAERTDVLREFGVSLAADPRAQIGKTLQAWSGSDTLMHFLFVLVDLNDDGVPDALALLTGAEYCGSGGCRLMVLRGERDGSFRVVSSSTVTREPVALLANRTKGWHTLIVSIAGGGVAACKVRMVFDGQRYPANPTLAPCVTEDELRSASPLTLTP